MHKLFGGSKSPAVDSVLKPVTEDPDEESSKQESSNGHKNSSTGESTGGKGDSSESFQVGKKETQMLRWSKLLVVVVIVVLAISTATLTYFYVKNQERQEYESQFQNVAKEIEEASQLRAQTVVENMESLGVHITSTAASSGQTWPFVVIPDFQVKGLLSNSITGAHTVSINPLVTQNDLEAWTTFSEEHQDWMERAHAYDETVNKKLYQRHHYLPDDDIVAAESEHAHDVALPWSVTGITPYVWTTPTGELADDDFDHGRKPVAESLYYAPIWHQAPACDFSPLVNYDLRSQPTFDYLIDGMLSHDHPVISQVVEGTYLETNYDHRFDTDKLKEPHSYILEPIHDNLTANRTAVAVLVAFLRWSTYFERVLPITEQGIIVVLKSTCNQSFTYEILGHDVVFLGEGDHHVSRLDADHLEHTYEFTPEDVYDDGEHHVELCQYYAHVQPSKEWKDKFFTTQPYTFAAGVIACFLITTVVVLVYDILVQRRQEAVMNSALKTNAIVNSLFPANVRDRLMDGLAAKNGNDNDDPSPWSDPSSALANRKNVPQGKGKSDILSSETIFGSKPIADLFPATTIMFCDMVGFTAWSSVREPGQVFSLLETVYHSFDQIAKRRRVFKVETVGDCYVAVAGLPMPRKQHAIVMVKFASDCLYKMKSLVHQLETTLGPDTADLTVRIGLHSGPVTAGVLRGERGRFQLFGDTMNTASRLESTGLPDRIHVSGDTAEILIASGKEKWVIEREDEVIAKGKGSLKTFWVKIHAESSDTGGASSHFSGADSEDCEADKISRAERRQEKHEAQDQTFNTSNEPKTALDTLEPKQQRLVSWNADILLKLLRQIMARRASRKTSSSTFKKLKLTTAKPQECDTLLDEVKEILSLPQFDANIFENHVDPNSIAISDSVASQMTDMLARIAGLYHDNPFHSFEHASHVTMSVTKLLSRIVNPNDITAREGATDDQIAANLHDHTFGITSDPLTQFACIISALIHDADHPGVPNSTLVKENDPLAAKYNNKSVAEQNSVDLAWDIITSSEYQDLQSCIYGDKDEFERFRSIVVNVVMATDIMDKDLGAQRKARWEKAFNEEDPEVERHPLDSINRKATIVLEHLMQASDVSHTMQHWVVFRKWNEKLFQEMYKAYEEGRSDKDPSESWYQGELGFFDFYIIPLAKKLETCGVFGVSSHEYLSYAQANRKEWEVKGELLVKDYLMRIKNPNDTGRGHFNGKPERPPRRTFSGDSFS